MEPSIARRHLKRVHDRNYCANITAEFATSGERYADKRSHHLAIPTHDLHEPARAVARAFASTKRGGRLMFENQQNDVETLIKSDSEFRSLYQRHQELDSKVRDAELGVLPLDDTTLHNMKKEKLWAKDKLTTMWERHRTSTH
jgi:uncharacterized protein YdcH (DUF465 family)